MNSATSKPSTLPSICMLCSFGGLEAKTDSCQGVALHRGSIRVSHPVARGSILSIPKIYLDVARFIHPTSSVESLIMLIEPLSAGRKKLILQKTDS